MDDAIEISKSMVSLKSGIHRQFNLNKLRTKLSGHPGIPDFDLNCKFICHFLETFGINFNIFGVFCYEQSAFSWIQHIYQNDS